MARVRIEVDGPVRTVTLTRADKRNALDNQMLDELEAAFTVTPPNSERLTVIRAEGPVFCSGMDLKARQETVGGIAPIEASFQTKGALPYVYVTPWSGRRGEKV